VNRTTKLHLYKPKVNFIFGGKYIAGVFISSDNGSIGRVALADFNLTALTEKLSYTDLVTCHTTFVSRATFQIIPSHWKNN
jgi:hypothetical protein